MDKVIDTAFKYSIGDVVNMRIVEEAGIKVLELEFRFARYCLVFNDETKTKEFVELIVGKVIWPEKKVEQRKTKLPRFYSEQQVEKEKEKSGK